MVEPEKKRFTEGSRRRWEDNTKNGSSINLLGFMDWNELSQDMDVCRDVSCVIKRLVPWYVRVAYE
jgi:hypothetical protein